MTRTHKLHVVEPERPPAFAPLIERGAELELLAAAVRRPGSVVVLDAPAGLGKTALLEHAAALAADAGFLVRRATPGPLESHFCLGVVRALLEAPLRVASGVECARLLDGAAASAGELLLTADAPRSDSVTLLAHSFLWLCSALAERRPLALFVDDAQWADRPSLEVLSYLARRIDELPLLIVVAGRADDPDAPADLLSLLGATRAATVLRPQPLTLDGAVRLIRQHAPGAPAGLCRRCHRAAAGNPWLLGELGRQIAASGPDAIDDGLHVTAIARAVVRSRLAELCPRDRGLAEALAVIGADSPPYVQAAVAGVAVGELLPAREALRAAGLLAAGGERFAHALVAAAISADLGRPQRDGLHRGAARALMSGGADVGVVASQLLECAPQADPELSEVLVLAASEAARRGEPGTAVRYLERALDERAPGDDRGPMLAQLGAMAFDAGLPDARRRLREALPGVRGRAARVEVLTHLAALNLLDAADDGLVELFECELAVETDPAARLAIDAAALDALMLLPGRQAERARRIAAVELTPTADPVLEKVVLAHRAWFGTELGVPDAAASAALAVRALDGGLLLAEARRRSAYVIATRTLMKTDHPGAERAIEALNDEAVARGSLRLRVVAAWYAAELALRTGRVAEAENHARLALELVDEELNVFTGGAVDVLVSALAERGAFDEARALLRERGLDGALGRAPWQVAARHARARLWLAEGDYERALAEARELGERRAEQWRRNPSVAPWRTTAVIALARLGRRAEAAELADTELAEAERFGAPVPIARALHARAVAEPDHAARIELLERALAVAPGGLESLRARIELGSTLTYLGRRVEARGALRPALADAEAMGAGLLAQRARRELVASGLRPRQAALTGSGALTPRQRQICDLAAAGKGNRAIAQELFLSIKTVETHLGAGYRKLGVRTREQLAAQLAA